MEAYAFSVMPIDGSNVDSDGEPPTASPNIAIVNEACELYSHVPHVITPNLAPLGTVSNAVFHNVDFVEPELEDVLTNEKRSYFIKRKTAAPVSRLVESKLEELSFVKLFPYGRNGESEPRVMKQTPLDYFQARVMSSDIRFSDPTYLFYALCQVEEHQIQQKIQVCCDMSRERNDDSEWCYDPRNVHLVLKSIRGSASYWKSSCSQTLAICRQLGPPTFFLTFSYDDLNSFDSVNAMHKRLHGYHEPDIDPQTLTYEQKKALLDSSPITAARHLNYRVRQLYKLMKKHSEQLFGYKLKDYTYRIEFQNRGSGTSGTYFICLYIEC